ncbi:MAG: hypothetical protein K2X87_23445 [Gemmataceae bacterium]|nr:hypothetical protein [Gemmataceae bacterium]
MLQAQRAVAEARLEYVRSLGEAWRAASEVAGLMLEDRWPGDYRPGAAGAVVARTRSSGGRAGARSAGVRNGRGVAPTATPRRGGGAGN